MSHPSRRCKMNTDCTLGVWMPSHSQRHLSEQASVWSSAGHEDSMNKRVSTPKAKLFLCLYPWLDVLGGYLCWWGTIKEHWRKSLNWPPVAQHLLGDWENNPRMSPGVRQLHVRGDGWREVELRNRNSMLNSGEKNQLQASLGNSCFPKPFCNAFEV